MNGKDLLIGLGNISTKYFDEAENDSLKAAPAVPHYKPLRKPLLIAAIIALTLLLVGCAALIWNIREMKIAEIHNDAISYVGMDGNMINATESSREIFTLHGLQGSPAYLAHQEWFAFLETYDQDHTLMNAADNKPMEIPEAYEAYSVYTQEMIDKIDEITVKYGLKLLGAFAPFQNWENHVFSEALGIDSLLVDGSKAGIDLGSGYFYEGGNFNVSFHMTMPKEDGQWPYEMLNEIYYSKSDYFDEIYWAIGDLTKWEQWSYTTKNGDELLILWYKDGGGARIFCNREDTLISVSIEGQYCYDYNEETNDYDTKIYMTKDQLKKVADELDFSLRVETVNMDLAKEKLQKFENQRKKENEKDPEGYASYLQKDYAAFIETHLAGKGSERYIAEQYALMDIDGDGTEELLLGNNDRIFEIVYTINGKAEMVHDGADESNSGYYYYEYYEICEDGYLISYLDGGDFYYTFVYTAEDYNGGKVEKIVDTLQYVPSGEYPWSRKNMETRQYEPITEEEYNAIIASYKTIDVEMKPISEFPSS